MRPNPASKTVRYILFLSILFPAYIHAQATATLEQQFAAYTDGHLQEKIYVHTDKNFYLAGDIVWFKLYNVEAASHKPIPFSKVAYLELIDAKNTAAVQTKLFLDSGKGKGSINLPVTLVSGNYKLRAYTSLMKNLGPEHVFEKIIAVVNTQKKREPAEVPAKPIAPEIRFFPEGGNLVYGINSKVACKVTNANGKGEDFTANIVDENNNSVARFQSAQFGMGSFSFTPQTGHRYKAIIGTTKSSYTQDLPAAYSEGYVMNLQTSAGAPALEVTVRTNISSAREIYLAVHTQQSLKQVRQSAVQNGIATFVIDKSILGEGISNITVFNENRQPVCERLYFKYPENKLQIKLTGNGATYAPRSAVNLTIAASAENFRPVNADMSLSVFQVNDLQQAEENDIHSFLWLTSDLKGYIESPGYYFENVDDRKETAIDNLMLTQGWRRFRWENILTGKKPALSFPLEYYGHIITGKVVNSNTGAPMTDIGTYVSLPGPGSHLRTSISDSLGRIKFDLKKVQGTTELIVQPVSLLDSAARIEIDNPFLETYSSAPIPPLRLYQANEPLLHEYNTQTQVQHVYEKERPRSFTSWADTVAFFGKPDAAYLLDDYTRFTTMEEVMREYVGLMNVIKSRDGFSVILWNLSEEREFETPPLILVDGVPVRDINKLFAFDPLKMRKLEVVNRRYILGEISFPGILSWKTYKSDLAGYELDSHATVIDYEGLQLEREFYTPVYDTPEKKASRLPDFRNLLYWTPDIRTTAGNGQQLSFYTSDMKGKYLVMVQGISDDGRSGSTLVEFEVK